MVGVTRGHRLNSFESESRRFLLFSSVVVVLTLLLQTRVRPSASPVPFSTGPLDVLDVLFVYYAPIDSNCPYGNHFFTFHLTSTSNSFQMTQK